MLRAAGINAPEMLEADLAQGCLLMSDLGRRPPVRAATATQDAVR
jgi:aminoglycoside/choline kinase family phosphotransferase